MAGKKRSKAQEKKDKATNKAIDGVATMIYNSIQKNKKPDLSLPVRSLSNVKYDQRKGYFEIGKST